MASKYPRFIADAEYETISTDDAVISVDTYTTYLDTSSGALTGLKLGDGIEKGQVKKIMMKAGTELAITEPLSNLFQGTNIQINNGIGNYIILEWIGNVWVMVDTFGSFLSMTSLTPEIIMQSQGTMPISTLTNVTNIVIINQNINCTLGSGYIVGQLKLIRYAYDSTSTATITSSFIDDGITTLTMNGINQQIGLLWTSNNKWKIITNIGVTVS